MTLWKNVKKLERSKYPSFTKLWNDYPTSDPCTRTDAEWQCAVYLSAALAKAGFIGPEGFNGTQGYKPNPVCNGIGGFTGLRLARGSQTLADYLHHRLFYPRIYGPGPGTQSAVSGMSGIVFFKNIAGFVNAGGNNGDHIDLWWGQSTGNKTKLGQYFGDCQQVLFWRLQ